MERTANSGSPFFLKEYPGYVRNGIKRFFVSDWQIWVSFLIPCFTLLISYFIFGVFPFGKESVLSLDLNGQYVYYYDYMYDVFAGKESIFYSWSRNLSGEFMGIVGYYLASPFNLLVWIFPRECITEGLLTMMVTKVGAIGLCMAVYLSRGKGMNRLTTIIFSVCYALCAYTLEQTMNPMWLDGVMILPIVVYGVEQLIDKGRFMMCTISLVYAFVTCFYIGYMIGIFSAIYFLYYSCVTHRPKYYRVFIQRGLLFTGVAVMSVMMSAFMLLPVYHSLSYGKFDFSDNVTEATEITTNFHFIEMLDKMFPATYDTCRMSGLPFIYCGTIVLVMLPCYFFLKKIRGRDRIGAAVIISLLCVCMYIRQVDMLWHGGQLPNWLPYRYSFMLSFLMVSFAARAFNEIKDIPKKRICFVALAWFAVLLMIENTDNYLADIKRDTMDGLTVVLPAMLVLLIVSAALVQLKDKFGTRKLAAIGMCVIITAEGFYNTISQIFRQDADIVYSTRGSYNDVIQPAREVVQNIRANDDGFYRIEKTFFRTVNDPMALNMYGLSHSSSTLNAKPINMLGSLGFSARSHYTRYTGATEITKSIFGVKYELSCPENNTSKIGSAADITVTENEYALPMAYLVHPMYQQIELEENQPFENQNKLLSAMLGKATTPGYFKRISNSEKTPVTLEKTNVTQGKTTDGHHSFKVIEKGKNAELVYTLNMPVSSSLYMYLPTKYERTVNVWLNRKTFLGTYFEGDNNSIMKIGDFEKGEQVKIGLTLTRDDLYFREAQFVYINERNIKKDLQKIIDKNAETTAVRPDPTTMRVEVNADETSYLFTSIPDEKGWEVFVDGKKTDYDVCLGALLGVQLSSGKHTIEFRFTTAGYPLAIFVSLAGLVIFIVSAVIYLRFFRSRTSDDTGDNDFSDSEMIRESGASDSDLLNSLNVHDDAPEDDGNDSGSPDDDTGDSSDSGDDEEEEGLLDIYQPKGSGSEWI